MIPQRLQRAVRPLSWPAVRHASSLADNLQAWRAHVERELKGKRAVEDLTTVTADVRRALLPGMLAPA